MEREGDKTGMYVYRNVEALSCNQRCRGKAVSISYSEDVFVVIGIQHEKRMPPIKVTSLACPAVSTLSHKRQNKLLSMKRVFRFALLLLTFFKLPTKCALPLFYNNIYVTL